MTTFDYPRSTAIKALSFILDKDKFSNDVLNQLLVDPKLSNLDRKFVTAMVYGVLDYLPLIDQIISNASQRALAQIDSDVLNILRIGVWQLKFADKVPQSSAVDESVKLAIRFNKRSAGSFINAVLRNVIRNPLQLNKKQEHLKYGMTSELYGMYKKWFGEEDARSICNSYLAADSQLTVLFRGSITERQNWLSQINAIGISVKPGILVNNSFILQNLPTGIQDLPGYQQGLFYVQDESSMLVAEVMQVQKNQMILDACAGLGGKTFALLNQNPHLKITALEPNQERYQGLSDNIDRLKIYQIKNLKTDLQSFVQTVTTSKRQFDQIILDVPCSGLGVLKTKPEIKLSLSYVKLQEFPAIQIDLLNHAAKLVSSTGNLLYSTCTINPAENEQLIAEFLESKIGRQFSVVDISYVLNKIKPKYKAEIKAGLSDYGLSIRPDKIPVDGFFISYLKRI
ncbi:MAG TPA: 16S rRNA (cytosine(967)-C(5))-methyltransferase RsmB [Clostridiaceae bacterium]|nr:16S rRNA (cytosine(967)-C(5))-methyltransferase RsmB [Clostridiaceae bacterium]